MAINRNQAALDAVAVERVVRVRFGCVRYRPAIHLNVFTERGFFFNMSKKREVFIHLNVSTKREVFITPERESLSLTTYWSEST